MSVSLQPAGAGLAVSGGMTLATAASLLNAGINALGGAGEFRFDLSGVTEIDSSGLAVLFAWQRAAQAQGKTLQIVNPPRNLISLAQVYGVDELLSMS